MTSVCSTENLISVVMPVHNSERFLEQSLKSVVAQTYANWELITVDDASTDGSTEIVKRYIRCGYPIRLIELKVNAGGAVARNAAIEAASGRFIAFLDSDDLWLPDKLERQVSFMIENNYPFTYCYYEKINEDGSGTAKIVKPPIKLSYTDLLKSNQIGCLAAMYDTRVLGKIYMPLIRKRQDYALWLRILKKIDFAHCYPEVLASYRLRSNSVSSNKMEMLLYNWRLFREIEGFSILKSAYYLLWNISRKVFS